MKKITRASIAAGAGLALIIGTGATLAHWNDTVSLGGAGIAAGTLQLSQKTVPTWQIQHASGAATPVADISSVRIVPGDKLVYTGDFAIAAQGDRLEFRADIVSGAITPATAGNAADTRLGERLTQSAEYTINGAQGQTATIGHNRADSGTYDVTIAVTLEWPFAADGESSASDNAAKLGSVSLSNFGVTATQLAASSVS